MVIAAGAGLLGGWGWGSHDVKLQQQKKQLPDIQDGAAVKVTGG